MTKDPSRSSELESQALALLHAARADHDPSTLDHLSGRRLLAERLLSGAPLPAASTPSAGMPLMASAKLGWLAAGVVLAGSTAVWLFASGGPAPESAARPARSEQVAQPTSTLAASPSPAPELSPKLEPASGVPRLVGRTAPQRRASSVRTPAGRPEVSTPQSAPAVAPLAPAEAAPAREIEPAASQEPAPVREAARATPAPARVQDTPDTPDTTAGEAASELDWMRRLESALRAGQPRQALELCAQHAQRWPTGTFAPEREAARVLAACQLHLTDSQARARSFLTRHPESALAPRVRTECQLLPDATKR